MKYLTLLAVVVPTIAFAQDKPIHTSIDNPTSPIPMMQNMIGTLASELATTSAKLTDAQIRINRLEQELKDKQPQDQPQKEIK